MGKFWQIIKGHHLKSVKRMNRCTNGNKNLIDPFVYENFSLTGLKCLNGKNITQSRNKWCWQNVLQNLYERIGTFITGCSTFKIESIQSYNMSNCHVTIWTRMQMVMMTTITRMITITVTTTVNNHSDNLIWSCCSLNKCVLKSITFHFSCH